VLYLLFYQTVTKVLFLCLTKETHCFHNIYFHLLYQLILFQTYIIKRSFCATCLGKYTKPIHCTQCWLSLLNCVIYWIAFLFTISLKKKKKKKVSIAVDIAVDIQ